VVNFLVNGIYGLARNPTYLGLLLSSHGWALAFRSGVGVFSDHPFGDRH
jgi:protein-S-isoprenylcysteine O-methyltransferase Ste14